MILNTEAVDQFLDRQHHERTRELHGSLAETNKRLAESVDAVVDLNTLLDERKATEAALREVIRALHARAARLIETIDRLENKNAGLQVVASMYYSVREDNDRLLQQIAAFTPKPFLGEVSEAEAMDEIRRERANDWNRE